MCDIIHNCIYFIPLYLVFCLVYHQFWGTLRVFLSCRWCSSKRIKEQAIRSQKKQIWAKQESMPRHGSVMPQREATQSKTRGQHAAACPIHAAAWQNKRACRGMVLSCRSMRQLSQKPEASMPQHAQFMPRHGDPDVKNVIFYYFWKVGFRTPIVTLLPLLL